MNHHFALILRERDKPINMLVPRSDLAVERN
jgi:hypothetical protein